MSQMKFQVSDVTKPLAAATRIVQKGNIVHFGPEKVSAQFHPELQYRAEEPD